jgi:prepilin-type processing-associated H-X9-DG protein
MRCDLQSGGDAGTGFAFEDIEDGLSNVFMVGERHGNAGIAVAEGAVQHDEGQFAAASWLGTGRDAATPANGSSQVYGYSGIRLNRPPGPIDYLAGQGPAYTAYGSLHPGGANFLLCDGSVRFISDTINFSNGGWDPRPGQRSNTPGTGGKEKYITPLEAADMGVFQRLGMRSDRNSVSGF